MIRVPPRTILILCLACCSARAQYLGGIGDGYDHRTLHNWANDGVYPPGQVYLGGAGDGYDGRALHNIPLNGANAPPDSAYRGGSADGYDAEARLNHPLDGSNNPPEPVFLGGPSDGYDARTVFNRPLDGFNNPPSAVYVGGVADGYYATTLHNQPLDNSPPPSFVFLGGMADGYAAATLFTYPIAGLLDQALYRGGWADGFAASALHNRTLDSLAPPFPEAMIRGGGGDGFDSDERANVSIAELIALNIYRGGAADGYDAEALSNHQMKFTFGSQADFGLWQQSLFTPVQILAGVADPDADADGDGLLNAVEFPLGTDPNMPNATIPMNFHIGSAGAPAGPFHRTGLGPATNYLFMVIDRTTNALESEIRAEVNSNLLSGIWTGNTVLVESTPTHIVFRDAEPATANATRFMRVIVVLQPP